MHVYLDESGDTGLRLTHGSSRFFVIALLVVDDPGPLESTLAALRAEMRRPTYEFKFAQSDDARRRRFFQAIRDERYDAYCYVIDKQDLLAIGAIHFRASRRDSLLQVADMLVGAVARSYEADDPRFRQLIPAHHLTVRELRL